MMSQMFSFEALDGGKTIQIHCDVRGMAGLLRKLADLVEGSGHIHFRGPSMEGSDLSEVSPFGQPAAAEVIIDYLPQIYQSGAK